MPTKQIETLDVGSRQEWRAWLEGHHDTVSEIWLVFHKRHTGVQSIAYNDAVEEALCFGWVDSLIRRLDGARYARKFTPRKPDSRWSTTNRRRYADLESRGLLAEAGFEAQADGPERRCPEAAARRGGPALRQGGPEGQPVRVGPLREAAPVPQTGIRGVDRLRQAGGDQGEASSPSHRAPDRGQEARLEVTACAWLGDSVSGGTLLSSRGKAVRVR